MAKSVKNQEVSKEPEFPRHPVSSFRIPIESVYEIKSLPSGVTAISLNGLDPIIVEGVELHVEYVEYFDESGFYLIVGI